jgi:hypothetical protein
MNARRARLAGAVGGVWLLLLAAALLVSAAHAHATTKRLVERAWGCDAFGYLRMAKEVRRGAAAGRLPDYRIETPHTRLLIEFFESHDVPTAAWSELVAPHAHHYFPGTSSVGPQYPPGTGLMLAAFPDGDGVHGTDRTAIAVFVGLGLAAILIAARTRAWAAAGAVVFAVQIGLAVTVDWLGVSFSIDAILAPLTLSLALVFLAAVLRSGAARPWASVPAAFLAGACFGFAVLVRLPALFLFPGVLILLLGATRRTVVNRTFVALIAGFGLCGAVPLLVHQQQVAGACNRSTYGPGDNSPPRLKVVEPNLDYYFGDGPGGRYNRSLLISLVGFASLALAVRLTPASRRPVPPVGGARVLLAALVLWGVSAAYFLTHWITTPYYQIPATFGAALLLGLGGLTIQSARAPSEDPCTATPSRRVTGLRWLMLAVAFAPGLAALDRAWESGTPPSLSEEGAAAYAPVVPAELADERAWVFADLQSGPLWYYGERPAYKAPFADAATRAAVYRFIHDRGEPLYVLRDSASMAAILDEIERLGGRLEPRGNMDGDPIFLIRWPATGPRT